MEIKEIVLKLVGDIKPVGCSSRDEVRLENLKTLCSLVDELVVEIDDIAYSNKGSYEHSVKEIVKYAEDFSEQLRITF